VCRGLDFVFVYINDIPSFQFHCEGTPQPSPPALQATTSVWACDQCYQMCIRTFTAFLLTPSHYRKRFLPSSDSPFLPSSCVQAIADFPPPSNQNKRPGMVNCYHRFIPHCSRHLPHPDIFWPHPDLYGLLSAKRRLNSSNLRWLIINNYSPKARWLSVNKNRDEVEVFIHDNHRAWGFIHDNHRARDQTQALWNAVISR
jgi:hypothetical protein